MNMTAEEIEKALNYVLLVVGISVAIITFCAFTSPEIMRTANNFMYFSPFNR